MKMYMKNIVKAIAVLAGIASLAACAKYAEYKTVPFVSFDVRSVSVEEADPAVEVKIPVHVYNVSGPCTVTYAVEAVSAQEGVDYSLANASGILSFPEGVDTQEISVLVSGQPGVYTGSTQFKVNLVSATADVTLGSINTCTVTIGDKDHPLANLFGTYKMSGVTFTEDEELDYLTWDMQISPVDGTADMVWINHITPFTIAYAKYVGDLPVKATVSADMKTITVKYPQDTGSEASAFDLDENFFFYGHQGTSGSYIASNGSVTFTQGANGSWKTTDSFGFSTPSATEDGIFYYFAVVFSHFSDAPTTFVKK